MLAIGLDVHQKLTMVATLDTQTGELSYRRVTTQQLVAHVAELPEPKCVGLETGSQSFLLARQLLSLGLQVMVLDAFSVHRRAEALHTAKTDRLDATAVARMVAEGGGGAEVWIANDQLDELRTLSRTHRQANALPDHKAHNTRLSPCRLTDRSIAVPPAILAAMPAATHLRAVSRPLYREPLYPYGQCVFISDRAVKLQTPSNSAAGAGPKVRQPVHV